MKVFFLLALFALCSQGARVQLESDINPDFIPEGWVKKGSPPPHSPISLLVGFKLEREEELISHLYSAGSPSSPSYGQWWSKTQVDDFVKPGERAERVVERWVKSVGGEVFLKRVSALWVEVKCSVEVGERLLGVKMERFFHEERGVSVVRSLEHYSVPEEVGEVVGLVGNVNRFPKFPTKEQQQFHQQKHFKEQEMVPEITTTTPSWIQERYNITIPPVNTSNVQAVVSFLDQYYKPSDLSDYEHRFGFAEGSCAIKKTVGYNNESHPGTECSLDVQYLQYANCSVTTWDYSTPGATPSGNEPFLNWLLELDIECTFDECPYVYSLSYQDYENTVSEAYAKAVNAQFEIITMTGRTFFSGSGDWGVGCKDLGYGPATYSCLYFNPDFISSSPFVVSLGATTLSGNEEIAVSWSSGGFSDYFPRPDYQKKAVEGYLATEVIPPTSYYNANGRGFPDLAVIGTNYEVFLDGKLILVGGTSASTPCFAQMVSLMNTMRFNAGLPSMGFVHPFLYESWENNANAYVDIVNNQPMEHGCCVPGFDCVEGWEPLNGLGTPNFGVLSQLALEVARK